MKQEILIKFPWLSLSSLALVIFFSFFVALLFIINSRSQKKVHEVAERIPMNEAELVGFRSAKEEPNV